MESLDIVLVLFNEFWVMGIIVLIDDFGIGFSLLVYLKKLFIDEFKIDCFFVSEFEKNIDD